MVADDTRLATGRLLLGARVRELRVAAGLQLSEVAEQVGVTLAFLSDLERGNKLPTLGTLDALAQSLGTSAVALLDGIYPWGSADPPAEQPTKPPDGRAGRRISRRQTPSGT